jgi:ubiquinone/menaquinone biosynthesis C-methylase UbiE
VNYDETDIAERYDAGRRLSDRVLRLWLDEMSRYVKPDEIRVILDVGCGTGRFSIGLAETFHAEVIGVDTSRTMLAKALKNISHHRVTFRTGSAEQLPVTDGSSCLAFLSMVYHHIGNPARAFRELHRALRVGDFVCIRQSTLELLDMVPYLKYFPAALEYNRARLPSQVEIAATARGAGLSLLRHSLIEQEFASSMREYRDKVKMRALSDLAALSDAEFDAGIRRMEDDSEQEVRSAIFEPIDLFIFQKVTSLEADR